MRPDDFQVLTKNTHMWYRKVITQWHIYVTQNCIKYLWMLKIISLVYVYLKLKI